MADQRYYNMNGKSEDTRYKVNNNILRMMNTNPALGIGYLIGNALGENYWGRKRAKTEQDADKKFWDEYMAKHGIGANENGVYGVNNNGAVNDLGRSVGSMSPMARRAQIIGDMRDYLQSQGKTSGMVRPSEAAEWKARNDVLNSMGGSNGKVLYEGRNNNAPRTPQQSNTSGVTMNNNGGTRSVADAWRDMTNNSGYNPGNTTLFTNGVRDMGNVIPGGVAGPAIGADANGVYGVPGANPGVIVDTARGIYPGAAGAGSAPSADNIPRSPQTAAPNPNPTPIPYTPEQLQQIKDYGGFTPEELQRMGAGELNAPKPESPSGGSGLLGSVVNAAANAAAQPSAPAAPATSADVYIPEVDMRMEQYGVPSADPAPNLAVANTSTQSRLPGYRSAIDWNEARAAQPTFGVNIPRIFNYVKDPNNPSFLDKILG